MSNVTLPAGEGTTQIDHVLVSTKGVFVLECKNYTGWIFASPSAPEWMQTLPRRRRRPARKFSFQNPVRQNFKHVQTVRQLLDFLPDVYRHIAEQGCSHLSQKQLDTIPECLLSFCGDCKADFFIYSIGNITHGLQLNGNRLWITLFRLNAHFQRRRIVFGNPCATDEV